jgi:hypothetical protein
MIYAIKILKYPYLNIPNDLLANLGAIILDPIVACHLAILHNSKDDL